MTLHATDYAQPRRRTINSRGLAIVPAYNEERTVRSVVERVRREAPGFDVVVVDDGSTDCTAQLAEAAGAKVLRHPFNLGIGGAVQSGYRHAFDEGYELAVQVDGDGQHDPAEIASLMRSMGSEEVDMVYGSRFLADSGYRAPAAPAVRHPPVLPGAVQGRASTGHGPHVRLPSLQSARDRAVRTRLSARLPGGRGDPDGARTSPADARGARAACTSARVGALRSRRWSPPTT